MQPSHLAPPVSCQALPAWVLPEGRALGFGELPGAWWAWALAGMPRKGGCVQATVNGPLFSSRATGPARLAGPGSGRQQLAAARGPDVGCLGRGRRHILGPLGDLPSGECPLCSAPSCQPAVLKSTLTVPTGQGTGGPPGRPCAAVLSLNRRPLSRGRAAGVLTLREQNLLSHLETPSLSPGAPL